MRTPNLTRINSIQHYGTSNKVFTALHMSFRSDRRTTVTDTSFTFLTQLIQCDTNNERSITINDANIQGPYN